MEGLRHQPGRLARAGAVDHAVALLPVPLRRPQVWQGGAGPHGDGHVHVLRGARPEGGQQAAAPPLGELGARGGRACHRAVGCDGRADPGRRLDVRAVRAVHRLHRRLSRGAGAGPRAAPQVRAARPPRRARDAGVAERVRQLGPGSASQVDAGLGAGPGGGDHLRALAAARRRLARAVRQRQGRLPARDEQDGVRPLARRHPQAGGAAPRRRDRVGRRAGERAVADVPDRVDQAVLLGRVPHHARGGQGLEVRDARLVPRLPGGMVGLHEGLPQQGDGLAHLPGVGQPDDRQGLLRRRVRHGGRAAHDGGAARHADDRGRVVPRHRQLRHVAQRPQRQPSRLPEGIVRDGSLPGAIHGGAAGRAARRRGAAARPVRDGRVRPHVWEVPRRHAVGDAGERDDEQAGEPLLQVLLCGARLVLLEFSHRARAPLVVPRGVAARLVPEECVRLHLGRGARRVRRGAARRRREADRLGRGGL
mmetsp:Transcript_2443/g.8488  ORF Transcript_2443/g.8488 Transcript_2443/m.8488 type:complete len:478 (-) Transcript_2443:392-1825(-)